MKIYWTCPFPGCKHKRVTTDNMTVQVVHEHNKNRYDLKPFKKAMKFSSPDSIKKIKGRVWDLFSEYIRRKEANYMGVVNCVTCGMPGGWKEMQAGHYVSRSHSLTFFDEVNVHPQCYHCNIHLKGNLINYRQYIIENYGKSELDRLERLKNVNHDFTRSELENIEKDIKIKLKEIS